MPELGIGFYDKSKLRLRRLIRVFAWAVMILWVLSLSRLIFFSGDYDALCGGPGNVQSDRSVGAGHVSRQRLSCGCETFYYTEVSDSFDFLRKSYCDTVMVMPYPLSIRNMSPVKRICVFEHTVVTNFNCACPAIQRG